MTRNTIHGYSGSAMLIIPMVDDNISGGGGERKNVNSPPFHDIKYNIDHNQYDIKKLPKTIPKTNHDYRKALLLKTIRKI